MFGPSSSVPISVLTMALTKSEWRAAIGSWTFLDILVVPSGGRNESDTKRGASFVLASSSNARMDAVMSPLVVFSSSSSPSSESSGSVFPVSPVFPAFPVSPACRKPHQKPKAVLRKQAQENRRKEKEMEKPERAASPSSKKSGEECVWGTVLHFYITDGLWVLGGKSVLNLQLIHNIFFRVVLACF